MDEQAPPIGVELQHVDRDASQVSLLDSLKNKETFCFNYVSASQTGREALCAVEHTVCSDVTLSDKLKILPHNISTCGSNMPNHFPVPFGHTSADTPEAGCHHAQ